MGGIFVDTIKRVQDLMQVRDMNSQYPIYQNTDIVYA